MSEKLEKRICQILLDIHPGYLTAQDICRELSPRGDRKSVNQILYSKLLTKGLIERNEDHTRPRYCASAVLVAESRSVPRPASRGSTPRNTTPRNDERSDTEEAATVREEVERSSAVPEHTMEGRFPAPRSSAVPEHTMEGRFPAPRSSSVTSPPRERQSVLPIKTRSRQNDVSAPQMQPVFVLNSQPYGNAPLPQYQQPTVFVQQQLPPNAQWMLVQPQAPSFAPHPESVPSAQRQPARSILPLKRTPKNPMRSESSLTNRIPVEDPRRGFIDAQTVQRTSIEDPVRTLNDGQVDASIFPDGLWNHVLYETREARSRTRAVEKIMSRKFAPEPMKDEGRSGMLTRVSVNPEGRGTNSLSMDAVESLNSMGPPPPGFTLTPRDLSPPDEPSRVQQVPLSMNQFSQDSSEDMSVDHPDTK